MSPRFPYEPPQLNWRVTLRLASGEPTLNDFGQVTAAAVGTLRRGSGRTVTTAGALSKPRPAR